MTDTKASIETVEFFSKPKAAGGTWQPMVGPETQDLLEHLNLPAESSDKLVKEATGILSRCVPPGTTDKALTGLTVGYVQSGKTMSFTTVAALARDNGFRLVIVIAGVSKPLLSQSTQRLATDLRINADNRGWQLFESQNLGPKHALAEARERLKATLAVWTSPAPVPYSWMRRTALIVVMKHHQHLERITNLLQGLDLKSAPVLVIDDEADQASLNAAVRRQDESRTYARIKSLRNRLPQHTYLQYTATPQAPLLINIIDALSPQFVEVLSPGPGYVGGKDFFLPVGSPAVREIPVDELPGDVPPEAVPDSLVKALQLFFVGVAAGFIRDGGKGNRSMMVHPSQQRTGHSEYYRWVMSLQTEWAKVLEPSSPYKDDRTELLREFEAAYEDLQKTVVDLPEKHQLFDLLAYAIANTTVLEINSRAGDTPKVDWKTNYSHILVGGQAMDRGFTVEGLTVTYMPRSLGVANADTVQQRARFFGYKRKYFGYCRVFLEEESIDAYRSYVVHEEDIRHRLIEHRDSGKPLSAWKRAFYLDSKLQPTRASVLELTHARSVQVIDEWLTPDSPHFDPDAVKENSALVEAFRRSFEHVWREDAGHPDRTPHQTHLVAELPLSEVMERCVLSLRFPSGSDARQHTIISVLLMELARQQTGQLCRIYLMSQGERRERSLNEDGVIKNLYQGAAPVRPKEDVGKVYPGDRKLFAEDMPTIQFHTLLVKDEDGNVVEKSVPTVAVRIPASVGQDLLIQHQPAQAR